MTSFSSPSPSPIDVGRSSEGLGLDPVPQAAAMNALATSIPRNLRRFMVLLRSIHAWTIPNAKAPPASPAGSPSRSPVRDGQVVLALPGEADRPPLGRE